MEKCAALYCTAFGYELIEFHRYMITLHRALPALRRGSLKQLLEGRNLIAYGRMRGINKCAIALNSGDEACQISLPVWEMGVSDGQVMTQLMLTGKDGYNAGMKPYEVKDGKITLELPGGSGVLLSIGGRLR